MADVTVPRRFISRDSLVTRSAPPACTNFDFFITKKERRPMGQGSSELVHSEGQGTAAEDEELQEGA